MTTGYQEEGQIHLSQGTRAVNAGRIERSECQFILNNERSVRGSENDAVRQQMGAWALKEGEGGKSILLRS
jgi:hypothetical protein